MNMTKWTVIISAASLLSVSSVAMAQEEGTATTEEGAGGEGFSPNGMVGLDLAFGLSSAENAYSSFAISPLIMAQYQFLDFLGAKVDWGMSFGSLAPEGGGDSSSKFVLGNPTLTVLYMGSMGSIEYSAGLGAAIPLASEPSGSDAAGAAAALGGALGARGYLHAWLWAPKTFSIVVPAEVMWHNDSLRVMGDASFSYGIYTGDNDLIDNEAALELGAGALYMFGAIGVGGKLGAAFNLTNDAADTVALSLQPMVVYEAGAFCAGLGATINLAETGSFEDMGWFGINAGAGFHF